MENKRFVSALGHFCVCCSAVLSVTTNTISELHARHPVCGICGVFVVTLIRIEQY